MGHLALWHSGHPHHASGNVTRCKRYAPKKGDSANPLPTSRASCLTCLACLALCKELG